MMRQFAILPVLLTLRFTISPYTANGVATSDVNTPAWNEDMVVPDAYTPFPDIGVGYKYFDMGLLWEAARNHCITEGGNLAVIDSMKKVEYAKSLTQGDTKYWLVGIHKYFSDSEWVSVKTDLPLSYIPWRKNEIPDSIARCVGLVTNEEGLQPFDCNGWSHLCEIPIELIPSEKSVNTTGGNEPQTNLNHNLLSTRTLEVPDGHATFSDIGVSYKYYEKNFTWDLARKHCIEEGGNLAVIDSFKKVEHASSKIPADSPTPFVGTHRLFDHSEWVNVKTGLPMAFVPWKGDTDLEDTTRLCAGLWTTGVSPFDCDARGSHMCEVPMFKTWQIPHHNMGLKPSPKPITELPSGYAVFPDVEVAYKYYNTAIPWNAARKYCSTHGANLAVIDSYEKVQYVIGLKTASTNVHVGLHRLFDDAEWVDVKDGSPATAIPWRENSYENETSARCMSLSTQKDDNGLFASTCSHSEAFVCELSIFED